VSFTNRLIVAALPSGIGAASYSLTVTNTNGQPAIGSRNPLALTKLFQPT
jgi:hypothetical protein